MDSPQGLCRRCLLEAGLGASATGHESPFDVPTVDVAKTSPGSASLGIHVRYFGDYELLGEVGRGGMGVVYKAEQSSLNRKVAVKLILAGQLASEAEVQRFCVEAQAAAKLQHPNIVAIYEVGEHDGKHYFAMEYIEGNSLADLVQDAPLPSNDAAQLVKTIAEAVQHAHSRGIIHRDLKPSNVLIDLQGQPQVTDFGLARRIDTTSDLTRSGQLLGTPSYMPPERVSDQRRQPLPESDVYSLGAILYELLTGQPPFWADSALDTLLLVIESEPVAPRRIHRKIPSELERVCLKALHKDPNKRYRSAQALADDLNRFLLGEPTAALREVKGRTARWIGGCALALVLFVGGAVWCGLKLFTVGVDWFQQEIAEHQAEQDEYFHLTAAWHPPPSDAGADRLCPRRVGQFTLHGHSDDAEIGELRIDVPGYRAIYKTRSRSVPLYVYRATELECEALLGRMQDLWADDERLGHRGDVKKPYYRYGPIREQRGESVIKRYGFSIASPPLSTALLWNSDWLLLARSSRDGEPEEFLKAYLQSMAQRDAPENPDVVTHQPVFREEKSHE